MTRTNYCLYSISQCFLGLEAAIKAFKDAVSKEEECVIHAGLIFLSKVLSIRQNEECEEEMYIILWEAILDLLEGDCSPEVLQLSCNVAARILSCIVFTFSNKFFSANFPSVFSEIKELQEENTTRLLQSLTQKLSLYQRAGYSNTTNCAKVHVSYFTFVVFA